MCNEEVMTGNARKNEHLLTTKERGGERKDLKIAKERRSTSVNTFVYARLGGLARARVEANANFDGYGGSVQDRKPLARLKLAFSLLYDSIGKAESYIAKRRKGQRRDKSIGQLFLHASQHQCAGMRVMQTLYTRTI